MYIIPCIACNIYCELVDAIDKCKKIDKILIYQNYVIIILLIYIGLY